MDLGLLFTALEVFGSQDVSSVCRVIEWCLKDASFLSIHDKYSDHLKRGMDAGGDISLLCLGMLGKVESRVEVERVLQDGLLSKAIEYMDSNDVALTTRASKGIQALHKYASQEQRHLIDSKLSVSSHNKHRLIDLMKSLSVVDDSRLLQEVKTELQTGDDLSMANALQTVKELCSTVSAFQAMESKGIFDQIMALLERHEQASFCLELLSGISMIGSVDLQSWIRQGIMQRLDHLLLDSDARTRESALFLVGALCANASTYKHIPKDSLDALLNCALSSADSIANAAIHGIAIAFSKELDQEHTEFLNNLLTTLQHESSNQLFDKITSRAKSCIPEDKSAAYFLLSNLVSHKFIIQSPGFDALMSFLLDRQSDASIEGMKWKYGVLEALHKQPWFTEALPQETQSRIIDYLRVGVVFIKRQGRVAYEHQ